MRSAGRPRRRHTGRRILIALLVVAGLLVAADRVGVVIAEGAVATTVQDSQHLAHRPDVDIAGFPFLTQLIAGDFTRITLSDPSVRVGDGSRTLELRSVRVVLRDVRVARDLTSATAVRTTATTVADYAALSRATGLTVSYAGAGRVRAAVARTLGGQQVSATVTVDPTVRAGELAFADPRVSALGVALPDGALRVLAGAFGAPIPLTGLPYDLTVRSLVAEPSGLHLTLTARQLTFRR